MFLYGAGNPDNVYVELDWAGGGICLDWSGYMAFLSGLCAVYGFIIMRFGVCS